MTCDMYDDVKVNLMKNVKIELFKRIKELN